MKDRMQRDEDGSIAITIAVMFIATGLVFAMLAVVEQGLRVSRRSGDSANALQVADAGVNDALKAVPTAATTAFTRSGSVGTARYTYTATPDSSVDGQVVWHIDAMGTDSAGVRRRVRADAVGEPLFSQPLFIRANANFGSGVLLDSYANGTSSANMCTGHGVLGTNTPLQMVFGTRGRGGGVVNCRGGGWSYSMDGCVSHGDGTQPLPPYGPGQCPPPPDTQALADGQLPFLEATTRGVVFDFSGSTLTCDAGRPLQGGRTYSYNQVNLLNGCAIANPTAGDVTIFASTSLDVGSRGGSNDVINRPPTGSSATTLCGATATASVPGNYFCPGWVSRLQVNMVGGAPVNINNNQMKFWGTIFAPRSLLTVNGAGCEMWGAVVANTADTHAQFTWHYDDSLTRVGTGRFFLNNWREEPFQ